VALALTVQRPATGWLDASILRSNITQTGKSTSRLCIPSFSPGCFPSFTLSVHAAVSLLPTFISRLESKKMGDLEPKHRDEMALDEKLENAEKMRGATTITAADAAMTRKILLKLDFRYAVLLKKNFISLNFEKED
jgi:hypothetical protein